MSLLIKHFLFQRKSMSASKELDSFGDREIRDIASQIMVGNIFSLLSSTA